jgi:hypothetical protein
MIMKYIAKRIMPAVMLMNYLFGIKKQINFKTLFSLYDEETEFFELFLRDIINGNVPEYRKDGNVYFYLPGHETFHNCVGKFRVIYNEEEKSFTLRDLYDFYIWCHEENHDLENCNCNLDETLLEDFSNYQGVHLFSIEAKLRLRKPFVNINYENNLFKIRIFNMFEFLEFKFLVFIKDKLFIGKGKSFLTLGKIYYNQELDKFFWEDGDVL